MQLTKFPISVGRVLHVYCEAWSGPRAAIVSNAWPGVSHANVNIQLDGANDTALLAAFRARPEGNTFTSVPVLDLAGNETLDVRNLFAQACEYDIGKMFAVWPPRV